jgi:tetratricopeptide (TPR) repeat protein
VELSNEALAYARQVGDPATLAQVLLARDYAIAAPDNVAERLAATGELLELAEGQRDPVITSRARVLRFRAALEMGDVDDARNCLEANEALVAELGQPALTWLVMMQRAGLRLLAGEMSAAEEGFLAAYQVGVATGQPDASGYLWGQLLAVRLEQGRMNELEELVRQLASAVEAPATFFGEQFRLAEQGGDDVEGSIRRVADRAKVAKSYVAILHGEAGRLDQARPIFDEFAAADFDAPYDFLWLRFATGMASLCAQLGDRPRAAVLHQLLEPYAGHLVTIATGSVAFGTVSHYLGTLDTGLGRFDEAETRFGEAAATHARIGAPTWLARTHLEWARMLLERGRPGDAERARELLDRALATARELGLAGVEQRAVALLA